MSEGLSYGKGLDVGTAFVVASLKTDDGKEIYRKIRDCYLTLQDVDDGIINMLSKAESNFIKSVDDDNLYVIGEHAIEFANMMQKTLGRPMASGVLNPQDTEVASYIMKEILRSVLGEPRVEGEMVSYSVPANPVDANFSNIYHKAMIKRAIEQMGYTAKPINEGLAVVYAENPIVKQNGSDIPFSGLGVSMGGGMINVCFAFRGMSLVEFSVANAFNMNEGSGGDWIDAQVSKSNALMTKSQVSKFKETYLDFSMDLEELAAAITTNPKKLTKNIELLLAIDIYYRQLISYSFKCLAKEFKKSGETIDDPIEVVIAGGTAMPNGVEKIVKEEINKLELPFDVCNVRKASNPLYTVASGCLVSAISSTE